ncbi:hypothetical protein [Flavobacterium sp. 3HN19-14]|uniref:hypothetical protein n=1 Tax=Flavobacterium sp. 3HN19-14 TaxID=3448133 RepID=UPI003EE1FC40
MKSKFLQLLFLVFMIYSCSNDDGAASDFPEINITHYSATHTYGVGISMDGDTFNALLENNRYVSSSVTYFTSNGQPPSETAFTNYIYENDRLVSIERPSSEFFYYDAQGRIIAADNYRMKSLRYTYMPENKVYADVMSGNYQDAGAIVIQRYEITLNADGDIVHSFYDSNLNDGVVDHEGNYYYRNGNLVKQKVDGYVTGFSYSQIYNTSSVVHIAMWGKANYNLLECRPSVSLRLKNTEDTAALETEYGFYKSSYYVYPNSQTHKEEYFLQQ